MRGMSGPSSESSQYSEGSPFDSFDDDEEEEQQQRFFELNDEPEHLGQEDDGPCPAMEDEENHSDHFPVRARSLSSGGDRSDFWANQSSHRRRLTSLGGTTRSVSASSSPIRSYTGTSRASILSTSTGQFSSFQHSLDSGMAAMHRWENDRSSSPSQPAVVPSLPNPRRRLRSSSDWDSSMFRETFDERDEHWVRSARQRTFSESEVASPFLEQHQREGLDPNNDGSLSLTPFQWNMRQRSFTDGGVEFTTLQPGSPGSSANTTGTSSAHTEDSETDLDRQARVRWIQINQNFQIVITFVAIIFGLLLLCILIGWLYLATSYASSYDKPCDLPLKNYFWLATIQLTMDVFRIDLLRVLFRYDSNSSNEAPCRVVVFNIAYLVYAVLVMRLGIQSVFLNEGATCSSTAPELYNASVSYVTLSLAAWVVIIFGYLVPFCIFVVLLTLNGYNPPGGATETNSSQTVFPAAYSSTGAPPECIDQLKVITIEDGYTSNECCICFDVFKVEEQIVETPCKHTFHKSCCREWLHQSRTCPVCREDIPSVLSNSTCRDDSVDEEERSHPARIPVGPTGRPVHSLLSILSTTQGLSRPRSASQGQTSLPEADGR